MFSIIIPTLNNLNYLKICIDSLKKNSNYDHQLIIHVNNGDDGTLDYLKKNNIDFTYTSYNSGICEAINTAYKKTKFNYIVYSHDDFYFCPDWDKYFVNEINQLKHNKFYFSGQMIGKDILDCGSTYSVFDEKKLLNNYKKINFIDFQGSSWAPHIIHKEYWDKVGGFSEEFFPGAGSDPDLNMKLWINNVRIFKGVANSKVYHFDIKTMRKEKNYIGSKSSKIFLMKWKISIKFFKKYYLHSMEKYKGELSDPKFSLKYFLDLMKCKINYFYLLIIYRNFNNLVSRNKKSYF